jgi:GAF domain-containing protein
MSDARELLAVREIVHAFLRAEHPEDVQQFALDRVTPLLGASFSLVMTLSADGALLRPVAQHEWPARHRQWIGALRVRVGDGPSGLAVAERRVVEVEDVLADASLSAWHEVATELGFRSIIAAPLEAADGPIGAVIFYFADATCVREEQRALVRLVADQLAAVTDKARQADALRRANAALAEANSELEAQASARLAAERARDASETLVVDALLSLTRPEDRRDASARLAAVQALASAAHEYVEVTQPQFTCARTDVDPRTVLLEAVGRWRHRAPMVPLQLDEPTVLLPTVVSDERWLTRAVELVVGLAVCGATMDGGRALAGFRLGRGFLAVQVQWTGQAVVDQPPDGSLRILRVREDVLRWDDRDPYASVRRLVTAIDLPLARAIAGRLGGELRLDPADEVEWSGSLVLVFPVETTRD